VGVLELRQLEGQAGQFGLRGCLGVEARRLDALQFDAGLPFGDLGLAEEL
jgi:hypothetical protein